MEGYGYPRPGEPSGTYPPPPPPPPADTTGNSPLAAAGIAGGPVAPPPRRRSRLLAVSGAFILAAAVAGAGIFGFFRGTADSLISDVPASSTVYVSIYLDPPGSQKLALQNLLNKFPKLSGSNRDDTINQWLDSALSSAGMNHNDIRSWFGTQVSIICDQITSQGTPPCAVIFASTNDGAAQTTLNKIASKASGTSKDTYNGVTIYKAENTFTAAFNHVVVMASTNDEVKKVVDVAQGHASSLANNAAYKNLQAAFPGDKVAFGYADMGAIGKSAGLDQYLGSDLGFTTMGFALSAQNDGLQLDTTVNYDPQKMTAQARSLLATAPHANAALGYISNKAVGVFALDDLGQWVSGTPALTKNPLLSSFSKVLGHLKGDAAAGVGLDLTNSAAPIPFAVAAQVDDANATAADVVDAAKQSTCNMSQVFSNISNGLSDLPTSSPAPTCTYQDVTQSYGSTTMHVVQETDSGTPNTVLVWAADGNVLVAGNNVTAVQDALDAHSAHGITSDPTYGAAIGHANSDNNGEFYLNIGAIYSAVKQISGNDSSVTANVDPWLSPIKSIISTSQNFSDHSNSRTFITIG